jgi:hypothetical protein
MFFLLRVRGGKRRTGSLAEIGWLENALQRREVRHRGKTINADANPGVDMG